ncbi:MAG: hypothetical protein ACOCY1_00655 [Halovenus sp.]
MSRYHHADERDLYRGLVVDEFGPEHVDLLDYLAHRSPADSYEIPRGDGQ